MTAENFPNLKKERDIQVQEAQRVTNKMSPRKHTLGHVIIKMSKVKDKERILKAAREHVQGISFPSNKVVSKFFSRIIAGQKRVVHYIQSAKRKTKTKTKKIPTKNALHGKIIIQN